MTEENAQRVVSAIEAAAIEAGCSGLKECGEILRKISTFFNYSAGLFGSRESVLETCRALPVEEAEEATFVALIESLASTLLPMLPNLSEKLKEEALKSVGRPKSLNVVQEQQVCAHVGLLYSQGVQLKLAKARAGRKFKVSVTTVERAWANRKEVNRKLSVHDVLAMLQAEESK